MTSSTYLWYSEGSDPTHGFLHRLCLYIKVLKLTLKLVHDSCNLEGGRGKGGRGEIGREIRGKKGENREKWGKERGRSEKKKKEDKRETNFDYFGSQGTVWVAKESLCFSSQAQEYQTALTFSRFMDLRAESIDFTTPAIAPVT